MCKTLLFGKNEYEISCFGLDRAGLVLYCGDSNGGVKEFDIEKQELVEDWGQVWPKKSNGKSVCAMEVSHSGGYLFVAGVRGLLKQYERGEMTIRKDHYKKVKGLHV